MVAVDEFELDAAPVRPAARRASRLGQRGERPGRWVALAVAAVGIGVLVAPITLSRTTADIPTWAGLVSVVYTTADEGVSALAHARDVVSAGVVTVGTGHPGDDSDALGSTVVVVLRDETVAADQPAREHVTALMDTASGALVTMTFDERMFGLLETAASRSDWVCEPDGEQTLCTALADPEITVVLDWP